MVASLYFFQWHVSALKEIITDEIYYLLCDRKTKSLKMSEKKLSETKNLTNLQNVINENGHFIKSVYS